MFCSNCGNNLDGRAQFCPECGSRVGATGSAPQANAVAAASTWSPPVAAAPSAYYAPVSRAGQLAEFGPRFGAWLLDALFGFLLAVIPSIVIAMLFGAIVAAGQSEPSGMTEAAQQQQAVDDAIMIGAYLGYIPVYFAYHYIATALGGGWGKRIVGLRVVREADGMAPGFGSALGRTLLAQFLFLFGIPYLWALWDPKRRTLHDKAAGTIVINAK